MHYYLVWRAYRSFRCIAICCDFVIFHYSYYLKSYIHFIVIDAKQRI